MSFQPPGGPPPPPPPGGPPPPGNPYPPQGYPGQWPQQQWAGGPPPKKRGNGWKWGLGALAVLVVIGVTAAVTISVTKDGADGADGGPSPTGETFGLASADDKGPANIITEDPSCAAWRKVNGTLADSQRGWVDRDPSVPATKWTPEQRSQYETVARAMRDAADQSIPLAKLTPHRVMREFYEQFIAYARAYSDAIPNYTSTDNHLASAALSSSGALTYACTAIEWGSAQAWAPLLSVPESPTETAPLTDPSAPSRFLTTQDPICAELGGVLDRYIADTSAWQKIDANTPASEWNTDQRSVIDAVTPVMSRYADDLEGLGRKSSNPTVQDFAVVAAQYRRAYVVALETYTAADSYLSRTSDRAITTISEACEAVGG